VRSTKFIGIPPRQPGLRASPRFDSANKLRGGRGSPDLADSSAFGFVLASNQGSASILPGKFAFNFSNDLYDTDPAMQSSGTLARGFAPLTANRSPPWGRGEKEKFFGG
jgi:hypothetical protein